MERSGWVPGYMRCNFPWQRENSGTVTGRKESGPAEFLEKDGGRMMRELHCTALCQSMKHEARSSTESNVIEIRLSNSERQKGMKITVAKSK